MDDFARAQIESLERRVAELERHLRLVYEHAGMDVAALPGAEVRADPEILELLRAGRAVQAIKLYAERHAVDLMTAKTAIERIHSEGAAPDPGGGRPSGGAVPSQGLPGTPRMER